MKRQVPVPWVFKGRRLGKVHEIDLLVDEEVIVDVKSVSATSGLYGATHYPFETAQQ